MAQHLVSLGTIADDGTGLNARAAFGNVNTDFTELFAKPWNRIPGAILDGTTDDYTAFAAVITAASTTNTGIVISGPMKIGTSITIPKNISLWFFGTGKLVPAASVVITLNGSYLAAVCQVFDCAAASSKINGLIKPIGFGGRLIPEHWGAVGDGVTDDSTAFQKCAKAAKDAGSIDIQLGAATYKLNSTIYGNGENIQSFNSPSWYGSGKRLSTLIDFSSITSGDPCFKFRGGSGQFCDAVVQDIGFTGNSTSIAIMFAGIGGMKALRCKFDVCMVGVQFHNEDASSFTEFCTADHCEFTTTCIIPIYYKRTSGTNSMHGSGMVNRCVIVTTPQTSTFTAAFVGGETSGTLTAAWALPSGSHLLTFSDAQQRSATFTNGSTAVTWSGVLTGTPTATAQSHCGVVFMDTICKVYNAPLDFNVWISSGKSAALINSNKTSGPRPTFHGTITLEVLGAISATSVTLGITHTSYFSGPVIIQGLTPEGLGVLPGLLVRCATSAHHSDSTNSMTGFQRSYQDTMGTGFAQAMPSGFGSTGKIVNVRIWGTNYDYRYLLVTDADGSGGAGLVQTLATIRSINTAAYGAPTFTVDTSSLLVITNSQALTFTGAFSGGETSGTLTGNWPTRPSGVYNTTFSNGDVRAVTYTSGAATATWATALSGAATTAATACGYPTTGVTCSRFEQQLTPGSVSQSQQAF